MSSFTDINTTATFQGPVGWTHRFPVGDNSLPFENIDILWWQGLLREHWTWALYIGVFYVVAIFGLQRWMKGRPALHLKMPLFWWNLALGLFSIVGFARTIPRLLETISKPNGFYDSICTRNWMDTTLGFWSIFFILSKPIELGDTFFSLLRKKPLAFVGWYHHLVTMVSVCTLGHMIEPIMIFFLTVNFGVHALMYPYFALKTIGYDLPKIIADIITTLELTQMIIGLSINIMSTYYKEIGEDCARSDTSIKVFAFVYASFLLVFGKLFYDSVIKSRKGKINSNCGIISMSGCGDADDMVMLNTKKLE